MTNFVCIFAIFLEIILTVVCVVLIIRAEKRIIAYNERLILCSAAIIQICKKIRCTVTNLNKVTGIITNKKFIKSFRVIRMTIDIIQIIILLKSLNLSDGLKSINYKNIKKIMLTEVVRRFLRRCVLKF